MARAVPVAYPKTARPPFGRKPRRRKGIRYWTNQPAEYAFFGALGTTTQNFTGLIVCHVYPGSPRDPRHFTRLANIFVVPKPLASFTEWGPVLAALKWRAFELYGYRGPAGHVPDRPALLPASWATPTPLDDAKRAKVIAYLKRRRRTRPMYTPSVRGPGLPAFAADSFQSLPPGLAWWEFELAWSRAGGPRASLTQNARDLEAEFWAYARIQSSTFETLLGWIVRHARFAPPRLVAALPNSFPLTRRSRYWLGERPRQVKRGITLTSNEPGWTALLVAIGAVLRKTRGCVVDHLWPNACYLSAHNAHLGGLVLLPKALAALADAPLVRAILQRRAFERTGYAGPSGEEPQRPHTMPRSWPEVVHLSADQEARALETLRGYLARRSRFYRKWRPGHPGRPPGRKPRR